MQVLSLSFHYFCVFKVYLNTDIAEVLTSDLPGVHPEQESSPQFPQEQSSGSEARFRELLLCGKSRVRHVTLTCYFLLLVM